MSSKPSNASTNSLQSTTTVTSTSPLSNAKPPPKDYAAAFATLQSRYGTGAQINIPMPKPDKLKLSEPQASSSDTTLTSNVGTQGPATWQPTVTSFAKPSKKKKGLFQTLKGTSTI